MSRSTWDHVTTGDSERREPYSTLPLANVNSDSPLILAEAKGEAMSMVNSPGEGLGE
jgi:hypothetical protein